MNVLWGVTNLVLGWLLLRSRGVRGIGITRDCLMVLLGALVAGVGLAIHFGSVPRGERVEAVTDSFLSDSRRDIRSAPYRLRVGVEPGALWEVRMGEQSGKVQTVQGLVEPGELGHVQPHEHLLVNLLPGPFRDAPGEPIRLETLGHLRRNWTSNPENLRLDSIEDAIDEMRRYRDAGGGALVEATCSGIGRDPRGLPRISRKTGVRTW